jgi:hypothetical protein
MTNETRRDYAVMDYSGFLILCDYTSYSEATKYFNKHEGKHPEYGRLEIVRRVIFPVSGHHHYYRRHKGEWMLENAVLRLRKSQEN